MQQRNAANDNDVTEIRRWLLQLSTPGGEPTASILECHDLGRRHESNASMEVLRQESLSPRRTTESENAAPTLTAEARQ